MENERTISIKEIIERSGNKYYESAIKELEEIKRSNGDAVNAMGKVDAIREQYRQDLSRVPLLSLYKMPELKDIICLDTLIQEISGVEKAKTGKERRLAEAKQALTEYEKNFSKYEQSANIKGLKKLKKELGKIKCHSEEMISEKDGLCDKIDGAIKSFTGKKNRFAAVVDEHLRRELEFLTEDKGCIRAFFTSIGYKLGIVTVEKEKGRREQRIERNIGQYKENENRLCYSLNILNDKITNLTKESFGLLSRLNLVNAHITSGKKSLEALRDAYIENGSKDPDPNMEEAIADTIKKGISEQKYVRELENEQNDVGYKIAKNCAEIEAIKSEQYNLMYRIKQNKQAMNYRRETLTNRVCAIIDPKELKIKGAIDARAEVNEAKYNASVGEIDGQSKGLMKNTVIVYAQQKKPALKKRQIDHETTTEMEKQMEAVAADGKALEEKVVQYKHALAQEPPF